MLKRLFEILKEIVEVKQQQKNRILLCYNPVMTIALAAQFLDQIADSKNIFRHDCKIARDSILKLGTYIIDNLDDDKIEQVFLDTDFKNRTVLKIATSNSYRELVESEKVSVLLDELWEGKRSFECDG